MFSISSTLRTQLLLLMFTRLVFSTALMMIPPFLPEFARGLGVELEQVSFVLSLSFVVSAFGVILAALSDRYSRKLGMLLGTFSLVIGFSLVTIKPALFPFLLAVILLLLGKIISYPTFIAYLGDRIPYKKRGFFVGIFEYSWALGPMICVPLIGLAIARWGWSIPFPLLAGAALVAGLLIFWMIDPENEHSNNRDHPMLGLKKVFQNPSARSCLLLSLFMGAGVNTVQLSYGAWMESEFGLTVTALGATSIGAGIAMLSGETASGLAVDRLGKKQVVAGGLLLNAVLAVSMIWLSRSFAGSYLWLLAFYFFDEAVIVGVITINSEVLPDARASLLAGWGAVNALGLALGAWISPLLFRWGFTFNTLITAVFFLLAILPVFKIQVDAGRHEPSKEHP